jgi:hypothetical protein
MRKAACIQKRGRCEEDERKTRESLRNNVILNLNLKSRSYL